MTAHAHTPRTSDASFDRIDTQRAPSPVHGAGPARAYRHVPRSSSIDSSVAPSRCRTASLRHLSRISPYACPCVRGRLRIC
jgi:hypothetical protein